MKTCKQELLKVINEVKVATASPVAIFTSNKSHAEMFEDWFPDVKIVLTTTDFVPNLDQCYIVPIDFNPLKLITSYEEEEE